MSDATVDDVLLKKYSPLQWRVIAVMANERLFPSIGLTDVAGHWFFGRPVNIRGHRLPDPPIFPQDTMRLLSALWPHASAELPAAARAGEARVGFRNKELAMFAVNGLMWEVLFPREFPDRKMHAFLETSAFLDLDREAAWAWLGEKVLYEICGGTLLQHRFWQLTLEFSAQDCVRIGRYLAPGELTAILKALPRPKRNGPKADAGAENDVGVRL